MPTPALKDIVQKGDVRHANSTTAQGGAAITQIKDEEIEAQKGHASLPSY